jgi:hypothetical protein
MDSIQTYNAYGTDVDWTGRKRRQAETHARDHAMLQELAHELKALKETVALKEEVAALTHKTNTLSALTAQTATTVANMETHVISRVASSEGHIATLKGKKSPGSLCAELFRATNTTEQVKPVKNTNSVELSQIGLVGLLVVLSAALIVAIQRRR